MECAGRKSFYRREVSEDAGGKIMDMNRVSVRIIRGSDGAKYRNMGRNKERARMRKRGWGGEGRRGKNRGKVYGQEGSKGEIWAGIERGLVVIFKYTEDKKASTGV